MNTYVVFTYYGVGFIDYEVFSDYIIWSKQ